MGGSFVGGFGEDRELMDQVSGLNLPLEELTDVMLLKDSSVVLLSAPGGCGKTTWAKMLCRDPKIQDIYKKNIFFATVSRMTSIKIMVQKLFQAKGYQGQFEKEDEALMRFKGLLEQQKGTGPILLVLDDVCPEGEPIIRKVKFNIERFKIVFLNGIQLEESPRYFCSVFPLISLKKSPPVSLDPNHLKPVRPPGLSHISPFILSNTSHPYQFWYLFYIYSSQLPSPQI
ncbi:hypothetical protein RJ639_021418 [Escallonia herrerae]|uniref:NB-ARC domain-containing protein n=1 Tax=Escallonia herrerae TaxID=1293975 RepID=A0AA88V4I6_9ASTE|nr:hypothetical protein RJ639_021418 [Escallonia herrerae]